jgi:hypothetical protein
LGACGEIQIFPHFQVSPEKRLSRCCIWIRFTVTLASRLRGLQHFIGAMGAMVGVWSSFGRHCESHLQMPGKPVIVDN